MDTTTGYTTEETQAIAQTIRSQVPVGVLMALGAHNLMHGMIAPTPGTPARPSLAFAARILPFTKSGQRSSSPRNMKVCIGLNGADYYDVTVTYPQRGDQFGTKPPVVHFEAHDVDCFTLPALLLALDYNGESATNPRYFPAA